MSGKLLLVCRSLLLDLALLRHLLRLFGLLLLKFAFEVSASLEPAHVVDDHIDGIRLHFVLNFAEVVEAPVHFVKLDVVHKAILGQESAHVLLYRDSSFVLHRLRHVWPHLQVQVLPKGPLNSQGSLAAKARHDVVPNL